MKRLVGVVFLMVFAFGCFDSSLRDPDRFSEVPPCRSDIDVEALFDGSCTNSACHGGDEPAAGLDLASPGVADRLIGVPSTCDEALLVDPADPDNSYLLTKLEDPPAGCGDRMPLIGFLNPDQLGCVRAGIYEWVTGE